MIHIHPTTEYTFSVKMRKKLDCQRQLLRFCTALFLALRLGQFLLRISILVNTVLLQPIVYFHNYFYHYL